MDAKAAIQADYKTNDEKNEENYDSSQMVERELAYKYIIGDKNCMVDGSYEQYLENFVYTDNPPTPAKEQNRDDSFATIYFNFMGLDETSCYIGENPRIYSYNHAFCNDLFYLEYPYDWYVGANDTCPLIFYHKSENEQSSAAAHDWREYYDDKLLGSKDEVSKYINNGGIDEHLAEVIGDPISDEYVLEQDEMSDDVILYYSLKKGKKLNASIIVWANIGKFIARNEYVQYASEIKDDYGRIMVYQEWDDVDFSTKESIMAYMTSGKLGSLLSPAFGKAVPWAVEDYETEYYDFLHFEADFGNRMASAYIPVTPSYNKNWLIVCEAYKGTGIRENAYDIQERIIKTFIALPYKYEVKRGDNLSAISKKYTGNPYNYNKIAQYKTNGIKAPNLIYPGQTIEIPLGLLFEKNIYD